MTEVDQAPTDAAVLDTKLRTMSLRQILCEERYPRREADLEVPSFVFGSVRDYNGNS
jgi:hypothetical protein